MSTVVGFFFNLGSLPPNKYTKIILVYEFLALVLLIFAIFI